MSSTAPPSSLTAASIAAKAQTAINTATNVLPVGMQDAARSVATGLANTAQETAGNLIKTGKTMAQDEIQNFADMIFHRVQDALQMIQTLPSGIGDKIIDVLGSVLSKLPLPAPKAGTNRQNIINADMLRQILKSPDTVSKQVVEDIAALWDHPNVKSIIELCNPVELLKNPGEALKKLSNLIGLGDDSKATTQAASKPAAKTEKPGWFRRCINWIGSFAGPSDPKELAEAQKKATGLKATWLKLPSIARKGVVFGGGALLILKAFAFGMFAVKAGVALFIGSKALKMGSNFLGGGKADDKPKGRSLFNPFSWFRSSAKNNSPMDEAQAASEQQPSGGWGDKLKKGLGHATKLMGHAQNFQTNPMGALTGLLGGGANGTPQNN